MRHNRKQRWVEVGPDWLIKEVRLKLARQQYDKEFFCRADLPELTHLDLQRFCCVSGRSTESRSSIPAPETVLSNDTSHRRTAV